MLVGVWAGWASLPSDQASCAILEASLSGRLAVRGSSFTAGTGWGGGPRRAVCVVAWPSDTAVCGRLTAHLFNGGDPHLLAGFLWGFGDPLAQYWACGGHSEDRASGVTATGRRGRVRGRERQDPVCSGNGWEDARSWALTGSRLTIQTAAALAQARMGGRGPDSPCGAERCAWALGPAEVPV